MKIPDQVITLEQAKKLKGLGVIQKGYFQWQETSNSEPYINHTVFGESSNENEYAAFTVAELGVMLPTHYNTRESWDRHELSEGKWFCMSDKIGDSRHYANTEAEARAAALIHLLENNHITADEVNARLQS